MSACKATDALPTPRLLPSSVTVDEALSGFSPALPLAVALSGGADSTALLLACARRWPGQVVAWHINHGLQSAAAEFEAHCRSLCATLSVPLHVVSVNAGHASGQSPEDAARIARYKEFDALALMDVAQAAIKSVAIAQHADDQMETVLLALSRGAGLAGLSAMPANWKRNGIDYYRPFLSLPGVEIRHWLAQQGQSYVEDPSNANQRYTRNKIRGQLMPALKEAFPQCLTTFARSASHAAQAQALLDEVAAADLRQVCRASDSLPKIKGLQSMSTPRMVNVLRHWLKASYQVVPSTRQLQELCAQIGACTTRGHHIDIKVGSGFVRRKGEVLAWYNP